MHEVVEHRPGDEPDRLSVLVVGALARLDRFALRVVGRARLPAERIDQHQGPARVIELRTMELQKLSGTLLQIQDEERRRIARELHDDLAQHVTAVKMELDASGRDKQLSDAMGAILQKIRETSYLLHPPLLDEAGLRAALHWYVDGLMQRSRLQISLTFHPDVLNGVPKEIEMTIFRIVQEALANVHRHASASRVSIKQKLVGNCLHLIIRDDGMGMKASAELLGAAGGAPLGVGIQGMRERLRQFGGRLEIRSGSRGTTVHVSIPLAHGRRDPACL